MISGIPDLLAALHRQNNTIAFLFSEVLCNPSSLVVATQGLNICTGSQSGIFPQGTWSIRKVLPPNLSGVGLPCRIQHQRWRPGSDAYVYQSLSQSIVLPYMSEQTISEPDLLWIVVVSFKHSVAVVLNWVSWTESHQIIRSRCDRETGASLKAFMSECGLGLFSLGQTASKG